MNSKAGQAFKSQVYQKFEQLTEQKHLISLGWVSDHSNVERNEKINMPAKEAVAGQRI